MIKIEKISRKSFIFLFLLSFIYTQIIPFEEYPFSFENEENESIQKRSPMGYIGETEYKEFFDELPLTDEEESDLSQLLENVIDWETWSGQIIPPIEKELNLNIPIIGLVSLRGEFDPASGVFKFSGGFEKEEENPLVIGPLIIERGTVNLRLGLDKSSHISFIAEGKLYDHVVKCAIKLANKEKIVFAIALRDPIEIPIPGTDGIKLNNFELTLFSEKPNEGNVSELLYDSSAEPLIVKSIDKSKLRERKRSESKKEEKPTKKQYQKIAAPLRAKYFELVGKATAFGIPVSVAFKYGNLGDSLVFKIIKLKPSNLFKNLADSTIDRVVFKNLTFEIRNFIKKRPADYYYDVLNVNTNASWLQIDSSYKKLKVRFDPSKQNLLRDKDGARKRLAEIENAYRILFSYYKPKIEIKVPQPRADIEEETEIKPAEKIKRRRKIEIGIQREEQKEENEILNEVAELFDEEKESKTKKLPQEILQEPGLTKFVSSGAILLSGQIDFSALNIEDFDEDIKVLSMRGIWSKDGALAVTAILSYPLTFGVGTLKDAQINLMLGDKYIKQDPKRKFKLSIEGNLEINIPEINPISVGLEGNYKDDGFDLTAKLTEDVAYKDITIKDPTIKFIHKLASGEKQISFREKPTKNTVVISGVGMIQDVEVSAALTISTITAKSGVTPRREFSLVTSVKVPEELRKPFSKMPFPDFIKNIAFEQAGLSVSKDSSGKVVSMSGIVEFLNTRMRATLIRKTDKNGKSGYAFSGDLPDGWSFSQSFPFIEKFDFFKLSNAKVSISEIEYKDEDSGFEIQPGMGILARSRLEGPMVENLRKILKAIPDELACYINVAMPALDAPATQATFVGRLKTSLNFGKLESIKSSDVGLRIEAGEKIGLSTSLFTALTIQPTYDDEPFSIGVRGDLTSSNQVRFSTTMKGIYKNAFGVSGFDFGNIALDMGVDLNVGLPDRVGLAGSFIVGSKETTAAILVAPDKVGAYAKFPEIDLGDVSAFANKIIGKGAKLLLKAESVLQSNEKAHAASKTINSNIFPKIAFNETEVLIAPEKFNIGDLVFPQGFKFKGGVNIADASGIIDLNVTDDGIWAKGYMTKIIIGPNDYPLLVITGVGPDEKYGTADDGPIFELFLSRELFANKMLLSGIVQIKPLGIEQQADINISKNGITIILAGKLFNSLEARIEVLTESEQDINYLVDIFGKSLTFKVLFKQNVVDKVKKLLTDGLSDLEKAIPARIESAQNDVRKLNNEIDSTSKDIDKLSSEISELTTELAEGKKKVKVVPTREEIVNSVLADLSLALRKCNSIPQQYRNDEMAKLLANISASLQDVQDVILWKTSVQPSRSDVALIGNILEKADIFNINNALNKAASVSAFIMPQVKPITPEVLKNELKETFETRIKQSQKIFEEQQKRIEGTPDWILSGGLALVQQATEDYRNSIEAFNALNMVDVMNVLNEKMNGEFGRVVGNLSNLLVGSAPKLANSAQSLILLKAADFNKVKDFAKSMGVSISDSEAMNVANIIKEQINNLADSYHKLILNEIISLNMNDVKTVLGSEFDIAVKNLATEISSMEGRSSAPFADEDIVKLLLLEKAISTSAIKDIYSERKLDIPDRYAKMIARKVETSLKTLNQSYQQKKPKSANAKLASNKSSLKNINNAIKRFNKEKTVLALNSAYLEQANAPLLLALSINDIGSGFKDVGDVIVKSAKGIKEKVVEIALTAAEKAKISAQIAASSAKFSALGAKKTALIAARETAIKSLDVASSISLKLVNVVQFLAKNLLSLQVKQIFFQEKFKSISERLKKVSLSLDDIKKIKTPLLEITLGIRDQEVVVKLQTDLEGLAKGVTSAVKDFSRKLAEAVVSAFDKVKSKLPI